MLKDQRAHVSRDIEFVTLRKPISVSTGRAHVAHVIVDFVVFGLPEGTKITLFEKSEFVTHVRVELP